MASPSKNQNYAYLSRLSTQKLLELLAAAPAPAETPEDKAYIDAIVEVVLEREERHPTGLLPDPEQAWEEFQQYYNTPEGEDLALYPAENPGTAPSEPAPSQTEYRPQRRPKRHFFRRVVIVAAVVVCIALPPALGFENVFQMFGVWTKDTFLLTNSNIQEVSSNTPNSGRDQQLSEVERVLNELEVKKKIIPTWMPEEYGLDEITINESKELARSDIRIHYINQNDGSIITIAYSIYKNITFDLSTSFEKDEIEVEMYYCGGTEHYIFQNLGIQVAVWSQDNIECSISGDITGVDLKRMIESIYTSERE